jgi:hypothetical protein
MTTATTELKTATWTHVTVGDLFAFFAKCFVAAVPLALMRPLIGGLIAMIAQTPIQPNW